MTEYHDAGFRAGELGRAETAPQEAHDKFLREYLGDYSRQPGRDSQPPSKPGELPAAATLPEAGQHHTSWLEGVENVAIEMGKGALDEVVHHPGRVVLDAAIGFGVGVGMACASPAVAIGAGAVMAGLSVYEVATHATKWIHDTSVVAHPELHDQWELNQATETVRGLGGGAVDVAAGIAGGVAGAKFAQSEMFEDMKGSLQDLWGKTFKTSYFDDAGRPVKLPLPDGNGSAYIKYDEQGKIISVDERSMRGWSSRFERNPSPNAESPWLVSEKNNDMGVYTDKGAYTGEITLDADGKGLTLAGQSGTQTLRADGSGRWTQTPEQKAVGIAWRDALNKSLAEDAARNPGSGAGLGAAMGLGMMVR